MVCQYDPSFLACVVFPFPRGMPGMKCDLHRECRREGLDSSWWKCPLKHDFIFQLVKGFPGGAVVKSPPASAGDSGSISGLGRSPGEGNGNPLQYYCLENPMDRGVRQATVHGVAKSQTRLNDEHYYCLPAYGCTILP